MKNKNKFTYYLIILLVLALAICTGILLYNNDSLQRGQDRAYTVLKKSLSEHTVLFNNTLSSYAALLENAASQTADIKSLNESEASKLMTEINQASAFSQIMILDASGHGLNSAGQTVEMGQQEFFLQTMQGQRVFTKSGIYSDGLIISLPIIQDSAVTGVIAGHLSENTLRQLLKSSDYNGNNYTFIADANGNIIISDNKFGAYPDKNTLFYISSHGKKMARDINYNDIAKTVDLNSNGLLIYTIDRNEFYAVYQSLGLNDWLVFNTIPSYIVKAELSIFTSFTYILIVIIILTVIALIILAFLISKKYIKKIEAEKSAISLSDQRLRAVLGQSSDVIIEFDCDEKRQPHQAVIITEPLPNINLDLSFFEQEKSLYLAMKDVLLCVTKTNLSQNTVELIHVANNSDYQTENIKTYDDLLQIFMPMAASPDDSHKIYTQMSAQNLISTFEHGSNFIVVQYKQNNAQGQITWVSNIINLLKDPVSGDLYAFSYLCDIDRRKLYELALPQKIEKDIDSYLYSAETTKHLVNHVISQNKQSDKLCALTVMSLPGLEQMKKEMGLSTAYGTITSISRLVRIISDPNMIIGYLGEANFVFFLEDVASAQHVFNLIKDLTEKIISINKHKNFIERLNPVLGIDILPMADASYELLLQHASQACRQTEEKVTEKRIGLYNHREQPAQTSGSDQTQPQSLLVDSPPDNSMLDDLTGVANRQSYIAAISQCHPDAISSLGILFTDINGLSKLNSDYGNEYGDGILIFTANMLQKYFTGSVYRISGDEFIVFALNLSQEEFRKRSEAAKKSFDETYPGYISMGITWANQHININKLIQHAENIMQIEKQDYYHLEERGSHKQRSKLVEQLQKDIQNQNFLLYLQPQLDLKCNKICGAEALVRLHSEEKGLIMPGSFIPGLEKENLIKYLDFYMLDKALSTLSQWKKEGRQLLPIAVNFSRLTLIAPNTFENAMEICNKYDLPHDLIKIEITESIGHVERTTAANVCERFSQAGFKIALDDFGSEYSSLYILSAIHFDEVKIDKNITSDIITNKLSQLTVANTKQFCRVCGSLCLAEGVETEEQLHMLKSLDCDMAQGYLFHKPMPVNEFEKKYLPLDNLDNK